MAPSNTKKTWLEQMKIAGKVFKDKCWYSLWNFDMFASVDRIYQDEGYYDSYCYLLMADANKITDKIFLGSAFNAADYEWLKENEIEMIINVTPSISNYYPDDFKYFNYGATDLDGSSLRGFYEVFYQTLEEHPDKKVFVHCFAGKSRSAALILYYLMRKYGWNLERALKHIKKCRPCINLNTSFIGEILELLPESHGESDDDVMVVPHTEYEEERDPFGSQYQEDSN